MSLGVVLRRFDMIFSGTEQKCAEGADKSVLCHAFSRQAAVEPA
jgi:hypothetical protein